MRQNDKLLLERLRKSQVEFVIVGGVGCLLYGAPLVTYDLDVCIRLTSQNFHRIEGAVRDLHPYHRLTPNKLPFELTDELCTRLKNIYLQTDLGKLDCLGEIAGVGDYDNVVEHSLVMPFSFGDCRVLTLEALMESKRATGRDRDLVALAYLRAIKDRPKSAENGHSQ